MEVKNRPNLVWEYVGETGVTHFSGMGYAFRAEVPGGWIYAFRPTGSSLAPISMVFVPSTASSA